MDGEINILASKIKMLVLDVDGVLTDGSIIFGHNGEVMKQFNAKDGMGIGLLHQAGIKTAIITGRESGIVVARCEELKIGDIYQGAKNKMTAIEELMRKHQVSLGEIAYVGDDLNDLAVLDVVGLPCAVSDAADEVKRLAKLIASKPGGRGAVREIIEYILKAKGKWDGLIAAHMHAEKEIIQ